MGKCDSELKNLSAENEVLVKRVEELQLALENIRNMQVPDIQPREKLDLKLGSFLKIAIFPLVAGLLRSLYKLVYRKK
jgi:molybdopterin converting factor small subunit